MQASLIGAKQTLAVTALRVGSPVECGHYTATIWKTGEVLILTSEPLTNQDCFKLSGIPLQRTRLNSVILELWSETQETTASENITRERALEASTTDKPVISPIPKTAQKLAESAVDLRAGESSIFWKSGAPRASEIKPSPVVLDESGCSRRLRLIALHPDAI